MKKKNVAIKDNDLLKDILSWGKLDWRFLTDILKIVFTVSWLTLLKPANFCFLFNF